MIKEDVKKLIYFSICLLITIFSNNSALSQQIEASASLDTNRIKIGEQFHLQLQIRFPAQDTVIMPVIKDTIIKEIEVVERSPIDTTFDKDNITTKILSQQFVLTSFDSGYYVISPFLFIINNDTVESEPLLIEVHTVPLDTSQEIKDIKAPIEVSYTIIDWLKEYWHWVVGVLLAIGIIGIIIYLLEKRKAKKPIEIIHRAPLKPAHVIALEKLDKLKDSKLWQQGKVKAYHSELSEIVREYIENRFNIMALEQTTDEILTSLRSIAMDDESRKKLMQLLRLSDLVKFAKEKPIASENDLCMTNAHDFITNTKENTVENNQSK